MLAVDIRVGVMIIVSNLAVGLSMDALTGFLADIDVDVLVGVYVNVFAGVKTAFEFSMSGPLEDFRC